MARDAVHRQSRVSLIGSILVIIFALFSVFLIALELLGSISSSQLWFVRIADTIVALFFLGEFIVRLVRSSERRHFLLFHWWELLAVIPITNLVTQTFRALRIVRILELIQVIRVSSRLETVGDIAGHLTDQPYIIEAFSTLLTVIFGSSVAFFSVEFGKNPNVHSLWDAFWWATTTSTTTGYGDIYPVTTAGRIIAMILMLTGAATVTLFIGTIAQYVSVRNNKR